MRPRLLERLLASLLAGTGERTAEWVRAALAELSAAPDRRARLDWLLGILGMVLGDLLTRTLLPWRRREGEASPDGFAAVLGLTVLGLAALILPLGPARLPFAPLILALAVALALWANLGVVVRGRHIAGLVFEMRLRMRLLNLSVVCLAGLAPLLTR